MNNIRAVVCLFGVIGRSIRYTYQAIQKNVIDQIKTMYEVDIYIFDLDVGDTQIDGLRVRKGEVYELFNVDYFETYMQNKLDLEILEKYEGRLSMHSDYNENDVINYLRLAYCEQRVSMWLRKNNDKYGPVVVCAPDYWPLNPINMFHLVKATEDNNLVFTSSTNKCNGLTHGFYIGGIEAVIKILDRSDLINYMLPVPYDYESILKFAFIVRCVHYDITNTVFFKIRNFHRDGDIVNREGIMQDKLYDEACLIINNLIKN